jgi:hypothetical protein
MLKKVSLYAGTGLLLCLLAAGPMWASTFTIIPQPTGAYTGSTALIPVSGADDTNVGFVSDGTLTVSFAVTGGSACGGGPSTCMLIENVPTGWATWGSPPNTESSTPTVLWSNGVTDLTMTLSTPVATFGFEAEPNLFQTDPMTANFYDSSNTLLGTINLNVNGNGGALLFAASVTGDTIASVELSDGNFNDFAIANPRYALPAAPVPEPASMLLLGTGLAGLGLRKLRRKK